MDTDEFFAQPDGADTGPWFTAAYSGDCDQCGNYFFEGDEIRADGEGGWQGRECCGDDD